MTAVDAVGAERDADITGDASAIGNEPAESVGGIDLARAVGWVLAAIGFVVGSRVITDNSFLTHLATGQLIVDQRAVPRVDPYSYLAAGESWTVQSWLVSLIYATLDSTVGGWAIRMLNGVLGATVVAGLWRLVTPARQLMTRVVLVSLALLIGTYLWPPRPLLFGLVAATVVLLVIQDMKPRWWLLPLFWVWVNSHGSYVLGCVLLGAVMLGATIDERRIPWHEVRLVAIGGLGCIAAIVNPLQWQLLWFPVHLMSRREALDRVSEWSSPSFRTPVEQLFLVLAVLIVFAGVRGAKWRTLVPSLLFFFLGLVAVRNLGLAALVIIGLTAPALQGLPGSIDGAARGFLARAVAVVGVAAFALGAISVLTTGPVDVGDYPIEEIDWLDERSLIASPDVRLAQRDYVGNYLTLRYGTEARVFMDDRFDFYPLEVISDHNELLLGGDMADVLDRRDFDVVLWEADTPLRRWLDVAGGWHIALDGDDWFVACREASPIFDRCS